MTQTEFAKILESRIQKLRDTLITKRNEYATEDVLHNFKVLLTINQLETPVQVLWGYLRKHLVSLYDMVEGKKILTVELLNEKIGDSIVYLTLLEALFLERLSQ